MFKELLILSRSLNLIYHHAHNIVSGSSFFADHAAFLAMYEALDGDYDSLVERRIGLGNMLSAKEAAEIVEEASELLENMPEESQSMFAFALQLESEYAAELKKAEAGQSSGTVNLLQGLADLSEARQYRIGQRLK